MLRVLSPIQVWLVIIIHFILYSSVTPSTTLTRQMQILVKLYNVTQGPKWTWENERNKWPIFSENGTTFSSSPCKWEGVGCTNSGGSVNSLNLTSHNLRGTLPENFFTNLASPASVVHFVDLSLNGLNGNIPAPRYIKALNLRDNELTANIGNNWCHKNLQYLDLSGNAGIHGILGDCIDDLNSSLLQVLDLSNSGIGGTLPTNLGNLKNLISFRIANAEISGAIPDLSGLGQLEQLTLSNNPRLGGRKIPFSFGKLTKLKDLQLDNCGFVGNLNFINPILENGGGLISLNVGENAFTGDLPPALFELQDLTSLVLGKNCFQGSIPNTICKATKLEYLILDGLSHACDDYVFKQPNVFDFDAKLPMVSTNGSLPSCAYSLPALQLLHASGNFLTGKMSDIPNASELVSIQLGHNIFTGAIPPNMMHVGAGRSSGKNYSTLGLSYNRLKQGLSSFSLDKDTLKLVEIKANLELYAANVDLSNNRLSGSVPSAMLHVAKLQILEGNMMGCVSNPETELPQQDPYVNDFLCGSSANDVGVTILGTLICLGLIAYLVASEKIFRMGSNNLVILYEKLSRWRDAIKDRRMEIDAKAPHCFAYIRFLKRLRMLSRRLGLIVFSVSIIYSVFKSISTSSATKLTYVHEYSWVASAAFLGNTNSAIFLICVWVLLISLLFYLLTVQFRSAVTLQKNEDENIPKGGKNKVQRISVAVQALNDIDNAPPLTIFQSCLYIIVMLMVSLVNIFVITFVNWSYTQIFFGAENSSVSIKSLTRVYLAVVMVIWNRTILPTLTSMGRHVGQIASIRKFERIVFGSNLAVPSILQVFNCVISPCIAVMIADPNCLNNLFYAAKDVEIPYTYTACTERSINDSSCIRRSSLEGSIEFTPTFVYNYECSSDVLEAYLPVFYITSIWDGFCAPLGIVASRYFVTRIYGWREALNPENDDYGDQIFQAGTIAAKLEKSTKNKREWPQWIRWVMLVCFVPPTLWGATEEMEYAHYVSGMPLFHLWSSAADWNLGGILGDKSNANEEKHNETKRPKHKSKTDAKKNLKKDVQKNSNVKPIRRKMTYADGSTLLSITIGNLAVLATFGIAAPVLAAACIVQIAAPLLVEEILLGRFLYKEIGRGSTAEQVSLDMDRSGGSGNDGEPALEESIQRVGMVRRHNPNNRLLTLEEECVFAGTAEFLTGRWIIVISAVVFLCSMLMDTAANEVGFSKSFMYPLILCSAAIFLSLYVAILARCNCIPSRLYSSGDDMGGDELNLGETDIISLETLGTAPKDLFVSHEELDGGRFMNDASDHVRNPISGISGPNTVGAQF